ncbi:MAG: DUF5058 family protein [Tenericutes bacterium]|jgi:hypothetical protein|nr:DUF5058 family protein [Mycoplasmatota bacterium]
MNINDVKEAWWLYLIGIIVTVFIISGALFFAYKAKQRAKEIDMPDSVLKKTVITSISFSILPSIGIFIGVITMAGLLGIPLPWVRLSVLGALHYELLAVKIAAEGVSVATLTIQNFVTISFVMTIAIIWGALFALFFFKKYQKAVVDKVDTSNKNSFANLIFQSVFIGLVSAFFGDAFSKIFSYKTPVIESGAYTGAFINNPTFVPVIVFVFSLMMMAFFDYLIKKKNIKWLENFQLSLSMVLAMGLAVVLGLGGIY